MNTEQVTQAQTSAQTDEITNTHTTPVETDIFEETETMEENETKQEGTGETNVETSADTTVETEAETMGEFIPVIRFVACSDTHIYYEDDVVAERFAKMFESAYRFAEADEHYKALDAVIVAGDLVDTGTKTRYAAWNKLVKENLREGTQLVTVMGNHEYIGGNHEQWLEYWEDTLDQHVVINGFHFIGLSPSPEVSKNEYSDEQVAWMSEQLAAAAAEDPAKPIFTFQHLHIQNTVYYSQKSYTPTSSKLNRVYRAYPQVINFSGDSHGPINNPKSIYQKDYTLLGTGALQNNWTLNLFEVDGNKRPSGWEEAGQYYIVEVDKNNRVRVYVYDIITDGLFKTTWDEENPDGDMIYYIDTPSDKSSFTYTEERGKIPPYFAENATITVSDIAEDAVSITYPQGFHPAGAVYGYRIKVECISNPNLAGYEMHKSSRYYDEPMPSTLTFGISELADGETYRVSVYPLSVWGKEGSPITCEFTTAAATNDPYTSLNRVQFNGTFSGFDCCTELTSTVTNIPLGGVVDGDIFTGGVDNASASDAPYGILAGGRGYQGTTALAITTASGGLCYYATDANGNTTHFPNATYLRLWVDFTSTKFEEAAFGLFTRSGERFSSMNAPSGADLPFYTLADGTSTWETKSLGKNGCFGSDMDGFKGWIAVPYTDLYSFRSTPKRQLDTDSIIGFFFYWKQASGAKRAYLDEIQLVADYTMFEFYTGSYVNDYVITEDDAGHADHLSVKKTYTEGEALLVTAFGSGKDWVYVMDKASADAGVSSSKAQVYAWWYVENEGAGIAVNAADHLRKGSAFVSGEYVVRFVPNDAGLSKYTEELVIQVVKPNLVVDIESHPDGLYSNGAGANMIPVTGTDKAAISLGVIDLAQYQAVRISYGGPPQANTANRPLALLNSATVDKTQGTDAENVLGYALMEAVEGRYPDTYYMTIDLADVYDNREVFLTAFAYTVNHTVQIYSIEFIAWPFGANPNAP